MDKGIFDPHACLAGQAAACPLSDVDVSVRINRLSSIRFKSWLDTSELANPFDIPSGQQPAGFERLARKSTTMDGTPLFDAGGLNDFAALLLDGRRGGENMMAPSLL